MCEFEKCMQWKVGLPQVYITVFVITLKYLIIQKNLLYQPLCKSFWESHHTISSSYLPKHKKDERRKDISSIHTVIILFYSF